MACRCLFILSPLFFLIACETVETSAPTKRHYISSYYGMESKPTGIGNRAHVREGDPNRLKRYDKVIIEDVKVLSSRNSDPKKKKASRAEAERLAERFEDILEKELSSHYKITRSRGYNTLAVRAALTELQPSNPALFAVNYMPYAAAATTGLQLLTGSDTLGAGSTTFEAEVVDSRSRRQLYAMTDQFKGSKFQPAGLDKWGQTESAMRSWSRQIRKGIQANETKVSSPPSRSSKTKPGSTGAATKINLKPSSKKASTKKKTSQTKSSRKTSDKPVNLLEALAAKKKSS